MKNYVSNNHGKFPESNSSLTPNTGKKQSRNYRDQLLFACMIIVFLGCCSPYEKQETSSDIFVHLTYGDCKEFSAEQSVAVAHQDCVEVFAGLNEVRIKHVNAAFNCCPGTINAYVRLENQVILVHESETEAGCDCQCLYDLNYSLQGLKPGTYSLVVVGPYTQDNDRNLECEINLPQDTTAHNCLDRHYSPWQ